MSPGQEESEWAGIYVIDEMDKKRASRNALFTIIYGTKILTGQKYQTADICQYALTADGQ